MKKTILSLLLAFCLILGTAPLSAFAADTTTVTDAAGLITAAANGGAITLDADITLSAEQSVEIPEGKTVTLNLAGHSITGADSGSKDVLSNRGTLVVNGPGTVENKARGAAVINYLTGNATLNGGSFIACQWYTLRNFGTLSINDGVSVSTTDPDPDPKDMSSLISNGWFSTDPESPSGNDRGVPSPTEGSGVTANLVINGGEFTGGKNTVKNDEYGKMEIKDGTFKNTAGPAILNWNLGEISGGEFEAPYSEVIRNGALNTESAEGQLEITGGTFTAGTDGSQPLIAKHGSAKEDPDAYVTVSNITCNAVITDTTLPFELKIESGKFSSEVPTKYIAQDKATVELESGTDKAFFIGDSVEISESLEKENLTADDVITVKQGDVDLANVATGVKVLNQGSGNVTVNAAKVEAGATVVATPAPTPIPRDIGPAPANTPPIGGTPAADPTDENPATAKAAEEIANTSDPAELAISMAVMLIACGGLTVSSFTSKKQRRR